MKAFKIKSRIKAWGFAGLLLIFLILIRCPKPVDASEKEEISLQVSYGLTGEEARYGRSCILTVQINNQGNTVQGSLYLTLASNRPQSGIQYEQPLLAVGGEVSEVEFSIRADSDISMFRIEFISLEEETLVEYEAPFQMVNYGEYIQYGLLSNTIEGLEYLQDFGSHLLQLNKSNFPSDKNGLDALDILLVDDYNSSELSQEQRLAVEEWVEAGGLLILSPGASIGQFENNGRQITEIPLTFGIDQEQFRKLREQVNQYEEIRGSYLIQKNERKGSSALSIYLGASMLNGRLLNDMQLIPINRKIFKLPEAASEICLREGTNVLAAAGRIGKGCVLYLAFSPEIKEQEWTAAQTWLAGFFLKQITETGKEKLDSERYGYSRNYWIEEILDTTNQERIPSIGTYFVIFILYLVLVSPILYLFLRRIDKTKYLWGMVPAAAIGFTLIVYISGSSTRVNAPYYGYFDVEIIDQKTGIVDGSLNFYAALPNNQGHTFTLKHISELLIGKQDTGLSYFEVLYNEPFTYTSLPIRFDTYTNKVKYDGKDTKVTIGAIPAFTKTRYQSNYSATYEEAPYGTILIDAENAEGSVTNALPFDLEDSIVYSNRLCMELGTVKSGETVEFTSEQAYNAANNELIYFYKDMPTEEYHKLSAKERRKLSAVKYAMMESASEDSSYFIGFADEITAANPLSGAELGKDSYGTTLLIVPIDEEYSKDGVCFVPNIDDTMEVVEGNLEEGGRYITTESLVVNYHLPEEEKVTEIVLSSMFNQLPKTKYSVELAGDIYFFNFVNRSYDFIFRCSGEALKQTQSLSEPGLADYIGESNQLQIRFVNTSLEPNCIIPYLSYYKKD